MRDNITPADIHPGQVDGITPGTVPAITDQQQDSESTAQVDSISPGDMAKGELTADPARENKRPRRKDNTSNAAHNRYRDANYKRFEILIAPADKDKLKAAAAALDMSPTALIIAAVNAYTGEQTLTPKAKNPYI